MLLAANLVTQFGLPSDDKRVYLQCRRPGLDPWVGKFPWRKEWLPTPVFLPGEFHGQRNLAGYSPWGHKELNPTNTSLSGVSGSK